MIDVLIVSSLSERYYYDAYVQACARRGIRVGILDPEHFVQTNGSIHVELNENAVHGYIDVVQLDTSGHTHIRKPIENIRVAWYLRVDRKTRTRDINDMQQRFVWNESICGIHALLSVLHCPWINTIEKQDALTSNKLRQQQLANVAGLTSPETLLSNSHARISAFAGKHNGLLLKTIGNTFFDTAGDLVLYSEYFTHDEITQSSTAIRACPVYAQRYIPKEYEYRVMYIGGEILACRIDSQASAKTAIDWRHYDFSKVSHIASELPSAVAYKIRAFMNLADLRYGALDLIETPHGEFIFLEVNPSGQWHWIEMLSQLPIAESVGKMLEAYMK